MNTPAPWHIRRARVDDAAQLAGLLLSIGWFSALEGRNRGEVEALVMAHLQALVDSPTSTLHVVEGPAGALLGYSNTHWLHDLFMPGPEGYLSELFVHDSARGAGIGSALLDALAAEARERGAHRLTLLNGKHRDSYARQFYEKHGWKERPFMANFVYELA